MLPFEIAATFNLVERVESGIFLIFPIQLEKTFQIFYSNPPVIFKCSLIEMQLLITLRSMIIIIFFSLINSKSVQGFENDHLRSVELIDAVNKWAPTKRFRFVIN